MPTPLGRERPFLADVAKAHEGIRNHVRQAQHLLHNLENWLQSEKPPTPAQALILVQQIRQDLAEVCD